MATIGSVTKRDDGRYEGELRTLSIRADVTIVPVATRSPPTSPTTACCRKASRSVPAGCAKARPPARTTSRLSIAAPEFGAKTLYANLGRAAGQSDPDVYALIWSPQD